MKKYANLSDRELLESMALKIERLENVLVPKMKVAMSDREKQELEDQVRKQFKKTS